MEIRLTQTTTNGRKKEIENKIISLNEYNLLTNKDTLKFFRQLGGTETIKQGYTLNGFCITRLTSVSPDKSIKIVREFNFTDYTRQRIEIGIDKITNPSTL